MLCRTGVGGLCSLRAVPSVPPSAVAAAPPLLQDGPHLGVYSEPCRVPVGGWPRPPRSLHCPPRSLHCPDCPGGQNPTWL